MRTLQRHLQTFYYRLYSTTTAITEDEYGNIETGEQTIVYSDPVKMEANISPASGQSITEQFGNLDNYDKVIVTGDMSCPIREDSVLYIDKVPTEVGGEWSPHDYVVRRVAKSVNYIAIAIRKVDVS